MKAKNSIVRRAACFAAAAAISLAGAPALAADGEIKIGVTIRMISDTGFKIGRMIEDEFALINAEGGVNGRRIEVVFLNDECKSDKGVENANKLVHEHKVMLVIGSSCSSVTLPIVDVTEKARTPQITPHSTNAQITRKNSEWIFRVPVSNRFYNAVTAEYVANNVGKKVAYIYASDAAGKDFARNMIAQMRENYGAEPVLEVQVQEKEIDFRPHLLRAKAAGPDALVLSALQDESARALVQSYEVGIPASVRRVLNSVASKSETPALAGDAIKGVFYSAAFSAADTRPEARLFTRMIKEKYDVLPDHDFSQAWDLVQIVRIALERADIRGTESSLEADRAALRDALATVRDYRGLAAGPINFCAAPTPQCRDGNRTPVLIEYVKGGENFETRVLDSVTLPPDLGL